MGYARSLLERRSGVANPESWLLRALGYRGTASGATVNEQTALANSTVFTCVSLIAEQLASLPFAPYRKLSDGGRAEATGHPIYPLLALDANSEMASGTLFEANTAHALTWGNGYAEIEFSRGGLPIALWPLLPNRTRAERKNGRLTYYTTPEEGGPEYPLAPSQVLHIKGLGFDGITGYSVIHQAREAIGLALATEEFGARFFGNGATVGGVLEHPGKLSDPARNNVREGWNDRHQGLSNAHRIAILEEGMSYKQIGIPPEDAQFLETRKFQKAEIASWFKVPLHMVNEMDRATFSNIEHQSIEFVTRTLRSWLTRWEREVNRKLVPPEERRFVYSRFTLQAMLRGDIKSRYEAYAIAIQNGWMSPDDVRALEDMNPIPDGKGKVYVLPLNMIPVDQLGKTPPGAGGTR